MTLISSRWKKARTVVHAFLASCKALHLDESSFTGTGSHNGAKAYLAKLRVGVKQARNTRALHEEVQIRSQAKAAVLLMETGQVVTVQESDAERAALWQQGDASLNTTDMLRARRALRRDGSVIEALDAIWQCVLRTEGLSAANPDAPGQIATRSGYECVLMRAYRVLLQDWDPVDASSCIADDWEADSGGAAGLTREAFGDAIFQVADMWVAMIHSTAYSTFLWRLFAGIAKNGWFKELDDVRFDGGLATDEDVEDFGGRQPKTKSMVTNDRKKQRASTKIQAHRRGALARRDSLNRKKAVIAIQAKSRGRLARKRVQEEPKPAPKTPPHRVLPPVSLLRPSGSPGRLGSKQRWALRTAECGFLSQEDLVLYQRLDRYYAAHPPSLPLPPRPDSSRTSTPFRTAEQDKVRLHERLDRYYTHLPRAPSPLFSLAPASPRQQWSIRTEDCTPIEEKLHERWENYAAVQHERSRATTPATPAIISRRPILVGQTPSVSPGRARSPMTTGSPSLALPSLEPPWAAKATAEAAAHTRLDADRMAGVKRLARLAEERLCTSKVWARVAAKQRRVSR